LLKASVVEVAAMDILYAPWRYVYIKSTVEGGEKGCIFCTAPRKSDDEALILLRGRYTYVIMNLYPYNSGHVMVVPYRHISDYLDLNPEEAHEMYMMAKAAIMAIREVMKPHGFNIGFNIGRVAGAGIDQHIHLHIVPRWNGDTNFMPVIAGTKVLSQDVREAYRALKPAIERIYSQLVKSQQGNNSRKTMPAPGGGEYSKSS
jgi:ATP adenylyltransferase